MVPAEDRVRGKEVGLIGRCLWLEGMVRAKQQVAVSQGGGKNKSIIWLERRGVSSDGGVFGVYKNELGNKKKREIMKIQS